jgi:hypothetical protein
MKKSLLIILNGVFLSAIFPHIANGQWVQTNAPVGKRVDHIAVSGSTIFAGTDCGIFLSTNNGTSWTAGNGASWTTGGFVLSFAVSGNNIFAGTSGRGVFHSTNNGTSWTAANNGLPTTSSTVNGLEVAGSNVFAGFAGSGGSGVFLSTNNGTSWNAVNNGLTDTWIYSLAVSGSTIFAGTMNDVFISTNNGLNWAAVNTGLTNTYVYSFAVSGSTIFAGTDTGIFLSTNNGTSWTAVNNGLTNSNVLSLAVSGGNIFAGTENGVFLSTNNGTSWTAVNNGMFYQSVYSLAVSDSNIFALAQGSTIWRRPLSEMIMTTPNQVILSSPKDSLVIYSDSVVLKWQIATSSVTKYHIQIATDSAMNFVLQDSTITDTTKLIKSLINGQTYWWKVRAYNAAGWGPFSQKSRFTVNIITIPGAVTLVNPADTAKIQSDSVLLVWNKANPFVTRYIVQIATDSAMNFAFQDSTITDTIKLFKPFTIGQPYWWRVKAYNPAGWGPFSPKRKFTYATVGVLSKSLEHNSFTFKGTFSDIQYTLPIQCKVSLKFYDVRGKTLASIIDRSQSPGYYSISSPVTMLPKGTYIQVFKAGSFMKNEKVISVH